MSADAWLQVLRGEGGLVRGLLRSNWGGKQISGGMKYQHWTSLVFDKIRIPHGIGSSFWTFGKKDFFGSCTTVFEGQWRPLRWLDCQIEDREQCQIWLPGREEKKQSPRWIVKFVPEINQFKCAMYDCCEFGWGDCLSSPGLATDDRNRLGNQKIIYDGVWFHAWDFWNLSIGERIAAVVF